MNKVYAVSSGTYSEYQVDAIFTTKELAQAYIDSYGAYGDFNDIEEYNLNPEGRQKKQDVYGFSVEVTHNLNIEFAFSGEQYEKDASKMEYIKSYGYSPPRLRIQLMARNEEHAIKIAKDKAAEIKATVGWGNLIK